MKHKEQVMEEIECLLIDNGISHKDFVDMSELINCDYVTGALDKDAKQENKNAKKNNDK